MSLNAGIVGLPNVGKSTIFNALTRAGARVDNFPFSTVDPNHGIVAVPDPRLTRLAELLRPPKVTPATFEVVDIAGLVKGAHRGEGLGNQFLGHIRTVDAVIHVVRCFEGEVTHVDGSVDPVRDMDVVELELALADLETVEARLAKIQREVQVGVTTAREQAPILARLVTPLRDGTPLRSISLTPSERHMAWELGLMTSKPVLLVGNVNEAQLRDSGNYHTERLRSHAGSHGLRCIFLVAQIEAEIAQLDDPADQAAFLLDLGMDTPGLVRVVREVYALLGYSTFYTFAGGKELRAWPIVTGTKAPQAAGRIHTDFERGFVRAEVTSFDDFIACGGESAARSCGLLRSEGKDYVVQDGDIVHFRFHV